MSKEFWKPIAGYEGLYDVSNLGRVRSLPKGMFKSVRILCPCKDCPSETLRVSLCKNGKCYHRMLKVLVAEAFVSNPKRYKFIMYKNGVISDVRAENLVWISQRSLQDKRLVPVRCIETGEIFNSMSYAAKKTGVLPCGIFQSIHRGTRAGGYHWEEYRE